MPRLFQRRDDLARISQTRVGVTEANLPTGQESREERIGNTVERPTGLREAQPEDRPDAACRQNRPALRVATGNPLGASKPSTVALLRFSGFSCPAGFLRR